jgi:hypothetical protein
MLADAGGFDQSSQGFQDQTIVATFVQQEPCDAPGCIQACLGFSAVDVVDPHPGIGACCRGPFDHQQLVSADTDMAVADPTDFLLRGLKWLIAAVNHDEIVAKAMHFQERASSREDRQGSVLHSTRGRQTRPSPTGMRTLISVQGQVNPGVFLAT